MQLAIRLITPSAHHHCHLHRRRRNFETLQKFIIANTLLLLLLAADPSQSTSSTGIKLRAEAPPTNGVRRKTDNTTYNAILNGEIALPCNITAPSFDDGVSLILWYRDDIASPIYTVDARQSISLEAAQHFLHTDIFEKRATFNLSYPLSFLRIKPVKSSDGGDYRCRVDFRRARTVNRMLKLTVNVPTTDVLIYDVNFRPVGKVAGPFEEDSTATLICDATEGNPLPTVQWWKGATLIDAKHFVVNNSISRNVLTLTNLTRDDLHMSLTCQAHNTNLTVPVSRTVTLDLYLKPREIRIITPLKNISTGDSAIELACQCSGSKPSARIRWRKGEEPIGALSETVSDDGLTTTSFITFVPSIDDDGKSVVCIGYNQKLSKAFSIQDTWPINIYYLPLLSLIMGSDSHSQDIIEGANVYFECNIKANPSVTQIGWLLNGRPLETNSINGVEMRNTSLLVTNVNHNHYGQYQCVAENSVGAGHSETVFLDVKYAPRCKQEKTVLIGVALRETVQVECQVNANPSDVMFEWILNSTVSGSQRKSPVVYNSKSDSENEGVHSNIAKFVAINEEDFGYLYCLATNSVGTQNKPCVFEITKAESPSHPHNCSLVNKTAHSLTLECLPGYSGGLEQTFYLQAYSLNPERLLKNLTNTDSPYFAINDLPAGYIFKLVIYSANRKGRSKSIEITGSTTVPSPWKSAEFETNDIYSSLSPLALIVGLLAILILGIVLLVIKIRNKFKLRRNTIVHTEKANLKSIMKKQPSSQPTQLETIEITELTNFKPDYLNECLETYTPNLSCTNVSIAQPYYNVPSTLELSSFNGVQLHHHHHHHQSQSELPSPQSVAMSIGPGGGLAGEEQTTNYVNSYDLCQPIHIIDVPH